MIPGPGPFQDEHLSKADLFLHIFSSLVNARLHTKNQLSTLPGSALKVPVGGWRCGGWWLKVNFDQLWLSFSLALAKPNNNTGTWKLDIRNKLVETQLFNLCVLVEGIPPSNTLLCIELSVSVRQGGLRQLVNQFYYITNEQLILNKQPFLFMLCLRQGWTVACTSIFKCSAVPQCQAPDCVTATNKKQNSNCGGHPSRY